MISIGIPLSSNVLTGSPGAGVDDLLLEDGFHLLLESGDALLLE
jgi:hypothetical protein